MNDAALGIVFGIAGGIIGLGAAIFAIFYATGFFEYLGGKKSSSIPPANSQRLKRLLFELNSETKPYKLAPSPETDILIEWKIADSKWFAFFGNERIKHTYRAYVLLDEPRKSVRYCEELVKVRWLAAVNGGVNPVISYQKQFFRGKILFQKTWETQYGIREDLSFGKVYEYKYDIRAFRDPIRKIILENGWEFVHVVNKKHATFAKKT